MTARALIVLLLVGGPLVTGAHAETVKCRAAISTASAAFVQVKATALQKCREAVVKGSLLLGPSETCPARPKVAAAVAKAALKLHATIAKACGGKNKLCNAADVGADADDTPGSVGFSAVCPNLENGACNGVIADCEDIAACVQCIGGAAVDQTIGLSYDALLPTDAKSKDKAEKALNKCQVAIGKHATKLLLAKEKILTKCWKAVNKSGIGTCPDAGADAAVASASLKLAGALAKACGGADKTLATGDDVTPAAIGFPTTCLNAAVPDCAASVGTLSQLVACVDCISQFKADCAAAAAIPGFIDIHPAKCNAGTKPATVFTLNAVQSGLYFAAGTHFADNYSVGWFATSSPPNIEVRDYFVFDLSAVTGTITAAFLRLSTAPPGSIRYGSSDPSETFTLFAVTTTLATLTGGTGGTSAFADLGNGATYGSVVAIPASIGATIDVSLNGTGIAFLQANAGQIAMGGAITTLAKGASNEFLFNATSAALTRQLVITAQQ